LSLFRILFIVIS